MEPIPFPADMQPVQFMKMMAKMGHNGLIGTQYLAHGPGWCELALPWREALVSDADTGILASGPIFTMMDMATSFSIWLKTGSFRPQATLDLRVDYLRPAKPGNTVIGRGECYHVTKSIAFVRGHAHDGDPDKPIANVAGTYFFTDAA
jgi:uncharacterized protein (TIGR00369 family)